MAGMARRVVARRGGAWRGVAVTAGLGRASWGMAWQSGLGAARQGAVGHGRHGEGDMAKSIKSIGNGPSKAGDKYIATAPFLGYRGDIMSETDLVKSFLLAVPRELPDVLVFERPIIQHATVKSNRGAKDWHLNVGVPGQADCYAVGRGGLHVELEMKALKGRLGELQKAWRARCLELGIPHLVLRAGKGETAEATVATWVQRLRATIAEQDWRHFVPDDLGTNPIRTTP
jgi:hypothetical protein